jgi:hypothetical protein
MKREPGTYDWVIWELRFGRMPDPIKLNEYEFAHVRSTINSFKARMDKDEVEEYLSGWLKLNNKTNPLQPGG